MGLLGRAGEVDWARVIVGPTLDGAPRPPLVVWRFKPGYEPGEMRLAASVRSYQGEVGWSLEHRNRNWSLQPRLVAEAFEKGGWRLDTELILHFSQHEPDFSRKSMGDFDGLIAHLEEG